MQAASDAAYPDASEESPPIPPPPPGEPPGGPSGGDGGGGGGNEQPKEDVRQAIATFLSQPMPSAVAVCRCQVGGRIGGTLHLLGGCVYFPQGLT